ncbi:MAG TPA: acyltransferase [Candidatus Methylacidiphilales bacterium]|nr:acyltransferase [Candidatus Methylacidiphilales bacterium]
MSGTPARHLSESLDRVSSIDALRGLAALSVVIYHAREIFWVGLAATYARHGLRFDFNAWLGYLSAPFSYGGLGVTLFFVLSGYCIHRRGALALAENPRAGLNFAAFARRRFWRIYPTYFCALLLTAAIDAVLAARTGYRISGQDDSLYAFLISLLSLQGYLAPFFGSNGVFWTLAMEIHLYLAYPLLFMICRRYGASRTVTFTLAVGFAYLVLNSLLGLDHYLPYHFQRGPVFLPYWFTWSMGLYLAEAEAGRASDLGSSRWGGLMVLGVLAGVALDAFKCEVWADMFWALFFAGILRWSLRPSGRRFWSGWAGVALAFVGVFSYSLYAVHGPILHAVFCLMSPDHAAKFSTLWPAVGGVVIALASAWLFFQLIERWSIRPPRLDRRVPGGAQYA